MKIELKERFKKSLSKKFSIDNCQQGHSGYVIDEECTLCKTYFKCEKCPFHKFHESGSKAGCVIWMEKVIGEKLAFITGRLFLTFEDKEKVAKQFEKLKEKAEELITWKKK